LTRGFAKGVRAIWGNASKWGKATIIATTGIVVLIVLGAILGEEDHSRKAESPKTVEHHPAQAVRQKSRPSPVHKPKQRAQQPKPSPAALRLQEEEQAQVELEESVKEVVNSADVACGFAGGGKVTCGVTYEIDELVGIDADEELLNAQRDVWETLFANPRFKEGFVELEAPVETVGGKESVDPVLRVRCDRAAARQIDWGNVQSDGMKQLCRWDQLVG
jgi:hypothetical protein